MAGLSGTQPPPLQLSAMPFLLAIALGPGAAMLGVYMPARLAAGISPIEGIRAMVLSRRAAVFFWLTLAGIVLVTGSGLTLWGCMRGWVPVELTVYAGVVFLGAFALVFPALLNPLARAVSFVLQPVLGVEAELAQQQIVRRANRAGLTAGVLFVAVAAGIGLGTTILNNVEEVRQWQRRTMAGDFFVRAMFQDRATGTAIAMPDSVGEEIRRIPGVTGVSTIRFLGVQVVPNAPPSAGASGTKPTGCNPWA